MAQRDNMVTGIQLDRDTAISIAQSWYNEKGPFAGVYKLNDPTGAWCNVADGSEYTLEYTTTPDTQMEYFVRFRFGLQAKGGIAKWSVLEMFEEGASKEQVELLLDEETMIAVAKDWYDFEGPFVGQYAIKLPMIATYMNSPNGDSWSLLYVTEPDAGGDVFVRFDFKLVKEKRKQGSRWRVKAIGEQDPSEVVAKPKKPRVQTVKQADSAPETASGSLGKRSRRETSKKKEGVDAAATGPKKARAASQKEDDGSGGRGRKKKGHVDPEPQPSTDGHVTYQVADNETPGQAAAKLGVEVNMLLNLNMDLYSGLKASSKLTAGTPLILPVRGAVQYEALNNETPREIGLKLNIDANQIVDMNKGKYNGLKQTAKLQAGTTLLLPSDDTWSYVAENNETLKMIATKLSIDLAGLVQLNRSKYKNIAGSSKLMAGTMLLLPAKADTEFIHEPREAGSKRGRSAQGAGENENIKRALAAIKATKIPRRPKLKSKVHEKMMVVWDIICSVTDGYGRLRCEHFLKLPSKTKYPEYYDEIEDPISLNRVKQKIMKETYADADEFEEDMTAIWENARAFYKDIDDVNLQGAFGDANVLQDIFWEALGNIEQGQAYKVKETTEDFGKPPKAALLAQMRSADADATEDFGDLPGRYVSPVPACPCLPVPARACPCLTFRVNI
jgi:hypothetical protein